MQLQTKMNYAISNLDASKYTFCINLVWQGNSGVCQWCVGVSFGVGVGVGFECGFQCQVFSAMKMDG